MDSLRCRRGYYGRIEIMPSGISKNWRCNACCEHKQVVEARPGFL